MLCNYLQNVAAITYIFVLQLSTFLFYNKHIYYDYASIAFHKKDKLEAHKLLTKSLEISTSINYQKGIDLAQNALSSLK